jgi:hypothetical protein
MTAGTYTKCGAGGRTRTDMRSEPRQILSLVRIPISPLRRRRMHMIRPFPLKRNFSCMRRGFNHTLRQMHDSICICVQVSCCPTQS